MAKDTNKKSADATAKSKKGKQSRTKKDVGQSILSKLSNNPVTRYLKGAYSELRKVTWPDRSETIRLTIGVIIYSLAFALFIALVDYIFDLGFERYII